MAEIISSGYSRESHAVQMNQLFPMSRPFAADSFEYLEYHFPQKRPKSV
jgi:hypothetical protein